MLPDASVDWLAPPCFFSKAACVLRGGVGNSGVPLSTLERSAVVEMANHAEDQELELEALEALFTREGEFEKLTDSSFRLRLRPFPDNEATNHVSIELSVDFPPEYPDTVPDWRISESEYR